MTDPDDTSIASLTDAQLWARANECAATLVRLLHPSRVGESERGLPYWLVIGMTVGTLEAMTRELSKREPQ